MADAMIEACFVLPGLEGFLQELHDFSVIVLFVSDVIHRVTLVP